LLSSDSLCSVLVCARIEAGAFADTLPEALALLRSHILPTFGKTIRHSIGYTVDDLAATNPLSAAVHSKSAEENPA
jgi:hypothetical protein